MLLVKSPEALRTRLDEYQKDEKSIGFVPTMGALHKGHLSLIEASKKENKITVCSIFVNPTQFNDTKDLEKYPITLESDVQKLEASGCDIVFIPSRAAIYPPEYTAKQYELGHLEQILEGKYRPGHFQGVCQVVEILLRIVTPDNLYLGQKDLQQCKVIEKLLKLSGLNQKIKLIICPTVSETDGLAMSSRNVRLNNEERKNATQISRTLRFVIENLPNTPVDALKKAALEKLTDHKLKTDYVEIVNADTLISLKNISDVKNIAVVAAAFAGDVRLIDNMVVGDL